MILPLPNQEKGISTVVLSEPFHLSYPFVFEHQGKYYLMPEASASGRTTLYEATNFPTQWNPIRNLLEGVMAYDGTLIHHEGYWYLFCNVKEDPSLSSDAYLHIYYAQNLWTDAFMPHPMNPIYSDVRKARPAGKIFYNNNRMFRPAQIGAPHYGAGICLMEILVLTPHHFAEKIVEKIYPEWDLKLEGLHTINSNDYYAVADVQTRQWKWI